MGRSWLYQDPDLDWLFNSGRKLAILIFWWRVPAQLYSGLCLINLGLAIIHSCNQNVIFRLRPDAKSRLNSIYMTLYFIGGACGSALGYMPGIMVAGA